ncbi:MAG: proprotein convertase P-domain-containing protein, partial [Calditrichaceae bacterium]|nr:proprotein convertase P-domain-containing protein [Calditrichaceae bacterium]
MSIAKRNAAFRAIFVWLFSLSLFTFVFAQPPVNYSVLYYSNAGNPGGINTEGDAPGISGWTNIVLGPQSANIWSPVQAIPFAFEFFGTPVTHFIASQNGVVTFDTTATALPGANTNLPSAGLPPLSIAGMWDEFTSSPPTATGDDVRIKVFGTAPNRQLWIKWYSFEYGNPFVSFAYVAIVLEETTNKIYVVDQYSSTTPLLTSTVGLQYDGSNAVQYGDSLVPQSGNGSANPDNDYWEFFIQSADDIGVTNVTVDYSGFLLFAGDPATIGATVQNFGANAASGFDVTYMVSDGSSSTVTYSGTLASGASDVVTFPTAWTPADSGTYTVTVYTTYAPDANPTNDTSAVSQDVVRAKTLPYEQDFTDYNSSPNSIGWLGADNLDFGTFTPSTTIDGAWAFDDFGNDPTLTRSARFNLFGSTTTDLDWLISPPIDMTSRQQEVLKYDIAVTPFTGTAASSIPVGDTVFVVASTDGTTWDRSNILAFYTNADAIPPTGMTETIDLAAYGSATTLYIGFLADDTANAGDVNFYVDNFFVGTPPALDVGPVALASPSPTSCTGASESVVVTVQNFTTTDLDLSLNPVDVDVNITGPINQMVSTTASSGIIPGLGTLDITVGTADLSAVGSYTFDITTTLAGDGNPNNDMLSTGFFGGTYASPYLEDFETFKSNTTGAVVNGWVNAAGDDFDWFPDSAGTPSASTGPNVDHTLGTTLGHYMFTESSSPNSPAKTANLISPCIDLSGLSSPVVSFWYHMFGATTGEIHVDVSTDGGATWDLDIMEPLVGQQQTVQTDPYRKASADLSPYAGGVVRVRFRGITGSSFTSDMAIDDVSVSEATFDVAANLVRLPELTFVAQSQPGITGSIDFSGDFSNNGPTNSGDVNVEVSDQAARAVVFSTTDAVTFDGFGDTTYAFSGTWDATAETPGVYDIAMFTDNFTDTDLSNDTSYSLIVVGNQLGYDVGGYTLNIGVVGTDTAMIGTRFTLTDSDTLSSVQMLITGSPLSASSFEIWIYSVDADTPEVPLHLVHTGTFGELDPRPVLATFYTEFPLAAGDYYAMMVSNDITSNFPVGAESPSRLGANDIPHRFGGSSLSFQGGAWLFFEDAPNTTFHELLPIIRVGFREVIHDFRWDYLTISEDLLIVDGTYTIEGQVTNTGNQTETNVPIQFQEDGITLGTQLVTLAPGASAVVSFSYTPNATGDYQLCLVTNIPDDSDPSNDSICRDVTVYPVGTTIQTSLIASGLVNKAILDNTTTLDTIAVDSCIILDMEVIIDSLTHTFDGDLDIFLFTPWGDSLELSTDNGGTGENYIGTIFDDQAAISITAGVAPFTGAFRPEGFPPGFGKFSGSNAVGDWVLRIFDDATGDTGTLHEWSIFITCIVPPPACTTGLLGDVNGDGSVTSLDALLMLSYDVGIPVPQPVLDRIAIGFGDVTEDGLTNSTDALATLTWEVGFPVPFPVGTTVCLPAPAPLGKSTLPSPAQGTEVQAYANLNFSGQTLEAPVMIDMANSGEKLGS